MNPQPDLEGVSIERRGRDLSMDEWRAWQRSIDVDVQGSIERVQRIRRLAGLS